MSKWSNVNKESVKQAIQAVRGGQLDLAGALIQEIRRLSDSNWLDFQNKDGPTIRALLVEAQEALRRGSTQDAIRALELIVIFTERRNAPLPEQIVNYELETLLTTLHSMLDADQIGEGIAALDQYAGSREGHVRLPDGRIHDVEEVLAGVRKWLWDSLQAKQNARRWVEASLKSLGQTAHEYQFSID